jgi:dTDP-glucose 4,6-dehydratase
MRLLITGAAGFIGSNFLRLRKQTHPTDELFVLDKLTYAGNYSSIKDIDGFSFNGH